MADLELIYLKATPHGKITFEEFLAWTEEDLRAEWEDGEIVMMSPVSLTHQDLASWLEMILRGYVRHHNLGKVIDAPFLVRLHVPQQGREPDLFFVKNENIGQLHHTYFEGPPDLMVEVIGEAGKTPYASDRVMNSQLRLRGQCLLPYQCEIRLL